ncbi:hypothetical protein PGT21_003213 [Puccinia graminis f. sp. tritici]|uniref:Amine oxidase domain-containing protein n=2 Tax=Puccinia graminis f. sp. tritici TaxID=56615 RepID=A0A5B0MVB7_PUCGR|nr:hypothetical protein PGT21_003213 [Puccinia graminis f. sp. tritici]KAA1079978.1 hypothetical protein PGTUg99_016856 [Puccinia graminis f. sp. tritici]
MASCNQTSQVCNNGATKRANCVDDRKETSNVGPTNPQQNHTNHSPIDVLVIGAGISGLTAALQLTRAGHPVTIVEARDRVGGRIDSHDWADGSIDLGASFLHGVDGNPLVDLLKQFDEPLYFENETDPIKIYPYQAERLSDQTTKELYDHANKTFFSTARTFSQSMLLPHPHPHTSSGLPYNPPPKSLYDFLLDSPTSPLYKNHHTPAERNVLQEIVNSLDSWTGASSEQVSLKWWGFEKDYTGEDGVLPNTYSSLIRKMASEFERLGGRILLDSECERIQLQIPTGRIRVRVAGKPEEIEAGCCVCTLPLGVLQAKADIFDPPLPPRRLLAISRTGFGLLNKVVVRYPTCWWSSGVRWFVLLPAEAESETDSESEGSHPSADSSITSARSSSPENHWPSPTMSGTSKSNSRPEYSVLFSKGVKVQNYVPITGEPVLVFYLGAEAGEAVEHFSNEYVAELIHEKLLSQVPVEERSVEEPDLPSECLVTRWRSDPYARGSYSFMKTKTSPKFNDHGDLEDHEDSNPLDLIEMSKPLWDGKLGFAGEHCSVDHYACVHGPYMTGLEEAQRIQSNYHSFNPHTEQDQKDISRLTTSFQKLI